MHIFCPQTSQEPYLRSTMKENHQNNCLLVHCHKLITDTLETVSVEIGKRFASANGQSAQKGILENLSKSMLWLSER